MPNSRRKSRPTFNKSAFGRFSFGLGIESNQVNQIKSNHIIDEIDEIR